MLPLPASPLDGIRAWTAFSSHRPGRPEFCGFYVRSRRPRFGLTINFPPLGLDQCHCQKSNLSDEMSTCSWRASPAIGPDHSALPWNLSSRGKKWKMNVRVRESHFSALLDLPYQRGVFPVIERLGSWRKRKNGTRRFSPPPPSLSLSDSLKAVRRNSEKNHLITLFRKHRDI